MASAAALGRSIRKRLVGRGGVRCAHAAKLIPPTAMGLDACVCYFLTRGVTILITKRAFDRITTSVALLAGVGLSRVANARTYATLAIGLALVLVLACWRVVPSDFDFTEDARKTRS